MVYESSQNINSKIFYMRDKWIEGKCQWHFSEGNFQCDDTDGMGVSWHTWCSNHAEAHLGMIFSHVIVKKKNELHKKTLSEFIIGWPDWLGSVWSGEQYPRDGSWRLRIEDVAHEGGTINNQDKSNNLRFVLE